VLVDRVLTYQELFQLKFKKGVSTHELVRRFPQDIQRVSEVALLEIPEDTLKQLVGEKEAFNRLMELKKKYSRFL
jgi:hypothetical protein